MILLIISVILLIISVILLIISVTFCYTFPKSVILV